MRRVIRRPGAGNDFRYLSSISDEEPGGDEGSGRPVGAHAARGGTASLDGLRHPERNTECLPSMTSMGGPITDSYFSSPLLID